MQEFEVNLLIDERYREITKLNGIKADLRAKGLDTKGDEYASQLQMRWASPCPIFDLCERIEEAKKRFAST